MIVNHVSKIDQTLIKKFYEEWNHGVIVLRDKALTARVMAMYAHAKHKPFVLKDDQHVNNGQRQYLFSPQEKVVDPWLLKMLDLYHHIRKPFGDFSPEHEIDYAVTEYPISEEGAKFHLDFSYNVRVTTTFFFGATTFVVAESKDGKLSHTYNLLPGDILFMRGPRDYGEQELALRPVHKIGKVERILHTLEVREVDPARRKVIQKTL